MTKLFRNRYNRYNLIAGAALLIIGFFWIYPFLWVIFASFKSSSESQSPPHTIEIPSRIATTLTIPAR